MRFEPRIGFLSFLAVAAMSAAICGAAPGPAATSAPVPAAAPAAAGKPAPGSSQALQKVTEVEGITEYRLPNGLTVLLYPDPSKPTITVNVTYLVGSRHENYGETGMAHLLEHMMFKGTPNHLDIPKDFNARGMRFNGQTSLDRTNYYELFQASDDNLAWALSMEADRMVNSFVARKDLDTEMTVVRNEYESGENSPGNVLIKRMLSVAFDWHNYAHSPIGNRSDIENVGIPNLQAFYHRYYQPDNAVLLVAGKFDPQKTLALITHDFGVIPKPKRLLPTLWTVEPVQDGERSFTVRRVGDIQVIALGYKVPPGPSAESASLAFAGQLLTAAPSGALYKALVETHKAVQVAAVRQGGMDPGLQIYLAVVKKGDPVEPVEAEMTRIVEGFGTAPPAADDMERVRRSTGLFAERLLNDPEQIGLGLSESIALGDWRMFFLNRDRMTQMAAEQVQGAAARYYRRDNRTVGLFLPEDQPQRAPASEAVSAASVLKDFKPAQATEAAEAFDPTPENLEKRTRRLQVDGMQFALLQKKTHGATVRVGIYLPAGDEKGLFGQEAAGRMAASMMMMGTNRYSRQQLQDEFLKLKVQGGVGGRSVNFETTRENLPAALSLAIHALREPAFPAAEFDVQKKLSMTSLESQLSDPGPKAQEALDQHFNLYPHGDPRHANSLQEGLQDLSAVTLDDVKRFYHRFYAANRAQVAIVGDFDQDEAIKAIQGGFAGWRNDTPWARITSDYQDIAPGNLTVQTPDKENAYFLARVNCQIGIEDEDYPALFLANYIIGGGASMDSRLMARIRVKEGLSYGVSSRLRAGVFDRAGEWNVQAIAAPQNIGKVEASFRDELDKLRREGLTAAELAKAKSGYAQNLAQQRAQDGQLVNALLQQIDRERTFAWDKQFEERVMAVTPEQAQAVIRKYLDPARITVVRAGDFTKAAAASASAPGPG